MTVTKPVGTLEDDIILLWFLYPGTGTSDAVPKASDVTAAGFGFVLSAGAEPTITLAEKAAGAAEPASWVFSLVDIDGGGSAPDVEHAVGYYCISFVPGTPVAGETYVPGTAGNWTSTSATADGMPSPYGIADTNTQADTGQVGDHDGLLYQDIAAAFSIRGRDTTSPFAPVVPVIGAYTSDMTQYGAGLTSPELATALVHIIQTFSTLGYIHAYASPTQHKAAFTGGGPNGPDASFAVAYQLHATYVLPIAPPETGTTFVSPLRMERHVLPYDLRRGMADGR